MEELPTPRKVVSSAAKESGYAAGGNLPIDRSGERRRLMILAPLVPDHVGFRKRSTEQRRQTWIADQHAVCSAVKQVFVAGREQDLVADSLFAMNEQHGVDQRFSAPAGIGIRIEHDLARSIAPFEVVPAASEIALQQPSTSQVPMCLGRLGMQANGPLKACGLAGDISPLVERLAEIDQCRLGIRSQFEGPAPNRSACDHCRNSQWRAARLIHAATNFGLARAA